MIGHCPTLCLGSLTATIAVLCTVAISAAGPASERRIFRRPDHQNWLVHNGEYVPVRKLTERFPVL